MVMQLAQNGDLNYFMRKNLTTLSWLEKLKILYEITMELCLIHEYKIVQHDLYNGNILISEGKPVVTDLGISKPMNASSTNNAIYSVIPYIMPEVFKGEKFI